MLELFHILRFRSGAGGAEELEQAQFFTHLIKTFLPPTMLMPFCIFWRR